MSWPFELKGKHRLSLDLRKEGFHVSNGNGNIGRRAAHAWVILPSGCCCSDMTTIFEILFLFFLHNVYFSICKICK